MPFVVENPAVHEGKVVDNGHCVRFCQVACPALPLTAKWKRGAKVRKGAVTPGTIIATFGPKGNYENRTDGSSHAAILVREDSDGLVVYDQWIGRSVGKRTIRFRGGQTRPCDDGDAFHVVEADA